MINFSNVLLSKKGFNLYLDLQSERDISGNNYVFLKNSLKMWFQIFHIFRATKKSLIKIVYRFLKIKNIWKIILFKFENKSSSRKVITLFIFTYW